ncbi:MAG: DegT/DnrJ/EryC1/StrS family aminotransferase [Candidatus Omnitrophica bacterium]|nr:DegT/DnrJ/EryC1/StrS family aminotransferase [Candidatus Omnitrophota bacterium]
MADVLVYKEFIPWAKPSYWGKEKEYALEAISSSWISGGPFVDRLEKDIARYYGCGRALTSSNGTAALHMAFLSLGLGPGDEIIVPGFGFMAAANVGSLMGIKPVFAEVDPDTWCMRAEDVEPCVTERTKAIVPIHNYGNVCPMDTIMAFASRKGIAVVEDAAESFASRYDGKLSGTFGTIGTFSFHATKTITTGEGGMAITDRQDLGDLMALYRSHGLLRKRHYWHEITGHNFRLTNMQAALGCAQMERLEEIIRERKRIHLAYAGHLGSFDGVSMQVFTPKVDPVLWATAVKIDSVAYPQGRDIVLQQMLAANIETRPGFYTAFGMKHLHQSGRLPVCEALSGQIISLPTFPTLSDEQIDFICTKLKGLRR